MEELCHTNETLTYNVLHLQQQRNKENLLEGIGILDPKNFKLSPLIAFDRKKEPLKHIGVINIKMTIIGDSFLVCKSQACVVLSTA